MSPRTLDQLKAQVDGDLRPRRSGVIPGQAKLRGRIDETTAAILKVEIKMGNNEQQRAQLADEWERMSRELGRLSNDLRKLREQMEPDEN